MGILRVVLNSAAAKVDPLDLARQAVSADCLNIALADGPALTSEVLAEIQALQVTIECLSTPKPLDSDCLS